MNDFDHKDLDWHLLEIFLTVLQESNVTRAAERLELTQSTVSHALKKLRLIFGNPLFVKSGKGIVPTERALRLRAPVREILDNIKRLSDERAFDPKAGPMHFVIAANDLQRELLFPSLLRDSIQNSIDLSLTFVPSGVPDSTLLNDARCDLIVTPVPPDGPDIIQRKLFSGKMCCFYDPTQREAPQTWEEFRQDRHISVRFASGRTSYELLPAWTKGQIKDPVVSVTNFISIEPFVSGSTLIATAQNHMALGPLENLAHASLPFETDPLSMFMVWHRRDSTDPAHNWLRTIKPFQL